MNLLNVEGFWVILKPIQADMELNRSGSAVCGRYHNSDLKGTIKGTLDAEGEDNILTGKWADQFGAGDFSVLFSEVEYLEAGAKVRGMSFYGNWKHSSSQDWDGIFEGEKRQ